MNIKKRFKQIAYVVLLLILSVPILILLSPVILWAGVLVFDILATLLAVAIFIGLVYLVALVWFWFEDLLKKKSK